MTVILHAGTGARADNAAAMPRAAATSSTGSFAAFLDDSPLGERKSERTFGFMDLGMFGRYGAQRPTETSGTGIFGPRPASDAGPAPWRQTPQPRKEAGMSPPCEKNSAGPPAQSDFSPQAGLQDVPGPAEFSSGGTKPGGEPGGNFLPDAAELGDPQFVPENDERALFSPGDPMGPAMDIVGDGAAETPAGTKGGKAAPPDFSMPHDNGANTLNLTVTASGDALAIVARSVNEGDAEIHERMKAVAAEFGMDIASFHLNGSLFQEMLSTSLGGKNGSRAR